jgi:hypothetical protein
MGVEVSDVLLVEVDLCYTSTNRAFETNSIPTVHILAETSADKYVKTYFCYI